MSPARVVLGVLGVLVGAYGAYLLVLTGGDNLLAAAVWAIGGALAHDLLLAPVAVLLGALGARALPPAVRAPAGVLLVVLGTITVVAVPFLGRFGALPDNPTLLDRDYTAGYAVLVGLVVLGVGLGALWLRRRSGPEDLSRALDDDTPAT